MTLDEVKAKFASAKVAVPFHILRRLIRAYGNASELASVKESDYPALIVALAQLLKGVRDGFSPHDYLATMISHDGKEAILETSFFASYQMDNAPTEEEATAKIDKFRTEYPETVKVGKDAERDALLVRLAAFVTKIINPRDEEEYKMLRELEQAIAAFKHEK